MSTPYHVASGLDLALYRMWKGMKRWLDGLMEGLHRFYVSFGLNNKQRHKHKARCHRCSPMSNPRHLPVRYHGGRIRR